MAGRPARSKALGVWMNGERVGTWAVSARGGDSFAYDEAWLASPNVRPLSLSLPLVRGTDAFRGSVVEAYFANPLPDSRTILERVARRYGVSAEPFALLAVIGRDCVGAAQLLPADSPPPDVRRIEATSVGEAEVADLLTRATSTALPFDDGDDLRISLAGAQEKTALLWHRGRWCVPHGATPTTHILKLPLGRVGAVQADFSTSVENEWLCSRIFEAFGLPVPPCGMARFGPHKALVVERFDRRRLSGWIARLPQEDMCQALGLPPERRYEAHGGPGMRDILDLLRGSAAAEKDRALFLKAQLVFWLLGAPDGHAKNFSLALERGGRFRLTPFYDVMSAWPAIGKGPNRFDARRLKLAMAVAGKNRHHLIGQIRRRHWNETAKRNALGPDFEAVIRDILAAVPAVIAQVADSLPPGFPDAVGSPILDGLSGQAKLLADMPPS